MKKIVPKNEVSIMKLSARRGLECKILHHLSQNPAHNGPCSTRRKAPHQFACYFKFSPATSKSIDIPGSINLSFVYLENILSSFKHCLKYFFFGHDSHITDMKV